MLTRTRTSKRQLRLESLETRTLLAADLMGPLQVDVPPNSCPAIMAPVEQDPQVVEEAVPGESEQSDVHYRPFRMRGTGGGIANVAGSDTGVAKHIGRFETSWVAEIRDEQPVVVGTLTAANGDELNYEFTYWPEFLSETEGILHVTSMVIDGGTGRFEDAIGSLGPTDMPIMIDPATGEFTYSYDISGVIAY